MINQTDSQLLQAYTERRLEAAFSELVRRHVDFVHSAAVRMVRDRELAEDVTQAVFMVLAQQATNLIERTTLAGWLHRTAQNIAAQTVRTNERRRAREQEAAIMNELLATPDATWEAIAPHLDAALGDLADSDRDAVLLRYFEKKSAVEMAAVLGISAEAAQKRVSRAVERLREFFAKRGVTVGAGGLVVVISANAVQAAPVGLAVTISAAALAGTATTSTLIAATTKTIAMTTLQKTLVTATVAVLAGAGIYEARQAAQLRDHQIEALDAVGLARQAAQSQFITAMNKAFEAKSPESLLALYCWDGVNEEEKLRTTKIIGNFFNSKFAPNGPKVSFKPVSLSKEVRAIWATQNEFTRDGIRYHPNLPYEVGEVWVVGKNQSKDGGSFTYLMAVGEKDGKLWFISNAPKP